MLVQCFDNCSTEAVAEGSVTSLVYMVTLLGIIGSSQVIYVISIPNTIPVLQASHTVYANLGWTTASVAQ